MQRRPKAAIPEVIANVTHHQRGVGFSTAPEMRLVTQSKLRLLRTSGIRASGTSTEEEASPAITSGAVVGAPSIYDLPPKVILRDRSPFVVRQNGILLIVLSPPRFLFRGPLHPHQSRPRVHVPDWRRQYPPRP